MRVLLVEDDPPLGAGTKTGLERGGASVDWALTAEEALAAAEAQSYAAIVLDLNLPDGDGLDVLKTLRRRGDMTPVLVVTARGHRDSRIHGLDGGADDYVVKPFDLDELQARLRALVRRREGRTSEVLTSGDVELDLSSRTVRLRGETVPVTAKEFRALATLMRRAGRFVSKNELEAELYDTETSVESNTIETAIYALRKKLGSDRIITARGLGYMAPR